MSSFEKQHFRYLLLFINISIWNLKLLLGLGFWKPTSSPLKHHIYAWDSLMQLKTYNRVSTLWKSIRKYDRVSTVWKSEYSMKEWVQYEKVSTVWKMEYRMKKWVKYKIVSTLWKSEYRMKKWVQKAKVSTVKWSDNMWKNILCLSKCLIQKIAGKCMVKSRQKVTR